MHIVKLEAENVKRLHAVSIKPDGNLVQITGANGAGKSSILDAITYALGGKSMQPPKPLRRGAKQARVVVNLGEKVVKRVWDADGSTRLTVESNNGARFSSPQKLLDDLVGELTFDPLAFSLMPPKKQAATLKRVAGLDFDDLDGKRASLFEKRTDVNRDLKALKARRDAIPEVEAPDEEVSVAELSQSLATAMELKQANDDVRRKSQEAVQRQESLRERWETVCDQRQQRREQYEREIQEAINRVEALRKAKENADAACCQLIADADAAHVTAGRQVKEYARQLLKLKDPDIDTIQQQISDAEGINHRVREQKQRHTLATQVTAIEADATSLSAQIGAIDIDKAQQLADASLPVDGLGIGDDSVTLNKLPFEQASSAEQLRVSVAMGIAINPKLRVMLIRDGSLLDADNLAIIAKMADEHDVQVWLERVADSEGVGVYIEDGYARGAEALPVETA